VDDIHGVETEIRQILTLFEQKETEETWLLFDEALSKLSIVIEASAHLSGLPQSIRKLKQPIVQSVSIVSSQTNASDCSEMDHQLPSLVRMSSST
jgi:hypothetical protein